MPYRGDYRRGDYRGDPGIFGGIAKLAGHLLPKVSGAIPFVGPLTTLAGGLIKHQTKGGVGLVQKARMVADPVYAKMVQEGVIPPSTATHPIGSNPHGTPHGASHRMIGPGAAVAKQHLLAAGVGHRRMNWANSRALARAERRIHAAVKHFSKYMRWLHPHKEGHVVPKFGKHKGVRGRKK